ncbi:type I-E CRISPR-associated protein Cas7/Cse4/CasC [Nocardia sp. NPDC049707]|uniref:type I-E CRISPR-associated protein Cas7/Cse4/CasC n=1 Tax=Nocardia sp. NPDC049707 TaxID=3154735 RepID=UPI003423ED3F
MHILQTVPPSNINRDDTGSPKSAVYGGVPRARVSSQSWKRATRQMFRELLDPATLGVRTKRVVALLAERITQLAPDITEPEALAAQVLTAAGIELEKKAKRPKKGEPTEEGPEQSKYLLFLSASQIDRLAKLAIESARTESAIDKSAARAAGQGANSVDVALFGRMVADATDLNIDAAAQVAHAISVHTVNNEFDYFTAVDDRAPEDNAGAGMIGLVEFNSSTLYRYATVNVDMLRQNLGDDTATVRAVETFLTAFIKSMPTGKQNTFANRTLPDAVLISLRTDQPVNLVNAFEEPVNAAGSARAVAAAKALVARHRAIDNAYGNGSAHNFVIAAGDGINELAELAAPAPLPQVIDAVAARVDAALGESNS